LRAVIQRVVSARVEIGDRVSGAIGRGLLVFVGVEKGDGAADVDYIASKTHDLRVFEDDGDADGRKRMNRSVADVGGSVLVVSQFTLSGDVRRGRRPSFDDAAPPEMARELYENVVRQLRDTGLTVETGEFQAMMRVHLENDGPVTILIDSRRRF
jgi:D-tyrosyl-tRNA(Tyr) deacylase